MNRRRFLVTATLTAAALGGAAWPTLGQGTRSAAEAVAQAHTEIWRRFIDQYGIMLDFTGLDGTVSLPTPEECREGKPNALGWWSPIENGAMFNGLYMDAAVGRWQQTKSEADAVKARKLMEGLLLLNTISEVPGFVGRGVSTDGRSHYPMGSNDQTFPWFFGLWRYLEDGPATGDERPRIIQQLKLTAEEIVKRGWRMPAELPFGVRGGFGELDFEGASRLLFVCKALSVLTRDPKWDALYRSALSERGGKDNMTRLEYCERGMVFYYARYHSWTSCCGVAAIHGLWKMETDETLRAAFGRGLQASADLAFKSLPLAEKFDHHDPTVFDPDWRMMNAFWKPQQNEKEAQDLAHEQLRQFLKVSPRRGKETEFVREPTAAAWVVTLGSDPEILKQRAAEVERVIQHYDYTQLYYSQFFWVESAWWRLQAVR